MAEKYVRNGLAIMSKALYLRGGEGGLGDVNHQRARVNPDLAVDRHDGRLVRVFWVRLAVRPAEVRRHICVGPAVMQREELARRVTSHVGAEHCDRDRVTLQSVLAVCITRVRVRQLSARPWERRCWRQRRRRRWRAHLAGGRGDRSQVSVESAASTSAVPEPWSIGRTNFKLDESSIMFVYRLPHFVCGLLPRPPTRRIPHLIHAEQGCPSESAGGRAGEWAGLCVIK